MYLRSFLLLAVFLNCPSALLVSKTTSPLKSIARTIARATSAIDTSSSSSTERMTGSVSLYSRSVHSLSRARSLLNTNCRRGLPDPETTKGSPFFFAR